MVLVTYEDIDSTTKIGNLVVMPIPPNFLKLYVLKLSSQLAYAESSGDLLLTTYQGP